MPPNQRLGGAGQTVFRSFLAPQPKTFPVSVEAFYGTMPDMPEAFNER